MSDESMPGGSSGATLVCPAGVTPEHLSAWRDGLQSPEQAQWLATHTAGCAACQARLRDYDQIGAALRGQVIPTSSADPWPAMRQRLIGGRLGARPPAAPVWGRLGAVVAAALVVALFAGLLTRQAALRPTATSTATVTRANETPAAPSATWTRIAGYNNLQGLAVAPSDPRIAYQVWDDANGKLLVRRTNDQGATWSTLTPPSIAHATYPVIGYWFGGFVSPFDARVVFLEVTAHMNDGASSCASNEGGQYPLCRFEFISTDSAQHWRPLALPDTGYFQTWGLEGQNDTQAHATRIYSMISAAASPVGHLVKSEDGGVTWRLIDQPIFAAGQSLMTYAATPTGATVFALTEPPGQPATSDGPPMTIWRSDDAGATWSNLGHAPGGIIGVQAAMVANSGKPILYTLAPDLGTNRIIIQGSLYGYGGSFLQAPDPSPNCSTSIEANPTLLATRADGSVLLWCGGAITSWLAQPTRSPGQWRVVARDPAINSIQNVFTQTLPGGSTRLWIVMADNTGAFVEYTTLQP